MALCAYLWVVIGIDVGAGSNRFDRDAGVATISRRGFRQEITVDIPLREIQAVKVEVRDGLNPRRRLALKVQGRRDMPLTRVGEPMPLADLELSGAQLARFLGVPLEGLMTTNPMKTNLKTGNLMTGNWWSRLLLGGLLLLAPLSLVACAADGGSSPVGCSTASTPASAVRPQSHCRPARVRCSCS